MASIESLQGTRKSLSRKIFLGPHTITPVTLTCPPTPMHCVELGYNAHARRIH